MDDWATFLSDARRMANLTQEDFAADLGVSRATLAHWENGRRPVPSRVKRRILDFMGGYYRNRVEFKHMLANAEAPGAFVTLYQSGLIIRGATDYAQQTWKQARNSEMVGQHLLPLIHNNMKLLRFYEKYYKDMLSGRSEIVSISYHDWSLLFPDRRVKATATVIEVGEGRILRLENVYLSEQASRESRDDGIRIITMDDAGRD